MNNIILLDKDKQLYKSPSTFRPIYQKEKNVDDINFLIGKDFFKNIKSFRCILQVMLPDENGEHINGNLKYLDFEKKMYKDHYVIKLPITTTLTKNVGVVTMWLLFFDCETNQVIKTSPVDLQINKANITSEVIDDDENVIIQLQRQITELGKRSANGIIYDEEDDTIQLCSGDGKLGDPIKLTNDSDIKWTNWE